MRADGHTTYGRTSQVGKDSVWRNKRQCLCYVFGPKQKTISSFTNYKLVKDVGGGTNKSLRYVIGPEQKTMSLSSPTRRMSPTSYGRTVVRSYGRIRLSRGRVTPRP